MRRLIIVASALLFLGWGGWLGREPLLRGIANFWIVSDAVAHADAAVVFGGGVEGRPFVAADLYHKGVVKKILVSQVADGRVVTIGATVGDTELNRQVLLKLGVPATAIETFGKENKNTREEALALRDWAESHAAKAFVIPVDIFFTRRARWMARRAFIGVDARIEVLAYEPLRYNRTDWWKSGEGIVDFQNEIIKYIYYRSAY